MSTLPTRHHRPGEIGLAVIAIALITLLMVFFERTAVQLAAVVAVVALLPLVPNEWSRREVYWRAFVAGAVVAAAIAIWLT